MKFKNYSKNQLVIIIIIVIRVYCKLFRKLMVLLEVDWLALKKELKMLLKLMEKFMFKI